VSDFYLPSQGEPCREVVESQRARVPNYALLTDRGSSERRVTHSLALIRARLIRAAAAER